MKIGSSIDVNGLSGDLNARGATRSTGTQGTARTAAATDEVAVSAMGARMGAGSSADFDAAKVDAIKQAIRDGKFTVNAEMIADRLIADARDLMKPRVS